MPFIGFYFLFVFYFGEIPCCGIHDKPSYFYVLRQERVMTYDVYTLLYGFFRVIKSAEP